MSYIQKKIMGFLTREDVELLEKASTRVLKHKKKFVPLWKCGSCSYTWFYTSIRCPSCSSQKIKAEKKA